MLQRWLTLTYYLYVLRFAALYHFYFNPLYNAVSACLNHRDGGRRSYVLFAGLFFFVPAMLHR